MICPRCKSSDVIPIIYGFPSQDAMKAYEEGRVKIGGCIVEDDAPNLSCKSCGKEWLTLILEIDFAMTSHEILTGATAELENLRYVTTTDGNRVEAAKRGGLIRVRGGKVTVTVTAENGRVSISYEGRRAFADAKKLLESLKDLRRREIKREALRGLIEQARGNLEIAAHDLEVIQRNLEALKSGRWLQTPVQTFRDSAPTPRLYVTMVDNHGTKLAVMNRNLRAREALKADSSLLKLEEFPNILRETDNNLVAELTLLKDETESVIDNCEKAVKSE